MTTNKAAPQKPAAVPATAQHHFDIGKILGLLVLGSQAYAAQDASPDGPKSLLTPQAIAGIAQGLNAVLGPQK